MKLLAQCLLVCIIELMENNLYSLFKKFNTDKLGWIMLNYTNLILNH